MLSMGYILEKVLYEGREDRLLVRLFHLFLVWQRNPEVLHIPLNPVRRSLSLQFSDFPRPAGSMILRARSY